MIRGVVASTLTALPLLIAWSRPAEADRCWMITYTWGTGNGSLEVTRHGHGSDDLLTYEEIIALARQNAQQLGLTDASITPLGIFEIGCASRR